MASTVEILVTAEDQASNVLSGIGSTFANLGSIISGIRDAFDMVANAIGSVIDFGSQFVDSASEGEQAVARLEGILRATSGAAGVTSEELQDLAGHLQTVTRFSDETILAGTSLLLTFRNIGGETLERTVPVMLDMAEIFGSVDSAAMQLGKALNEPTTMLGALTRAGVTFSEEQKAMIERFVEMGDIASAQNIILTEVEQQVGSLSIAMGQTFAGQVEIARNKLDEMRETIGNVLLPILGDLIDTFSNFMDTNPMVQGVLSFFESWREFIDAGAAPLAALGLTLNTFEGLSTPLTEIGYALIIVSNALKDGEAPFDAFRAGLDYLSNWGGLAGTPFEGIVDTIREFIDTAETEGLGTAIGNLFSDAFANFDLSDSIQVLLDKLTEGMEGADWEDIGGTTARIVADIFATALTITLTTLDEIVNNVPWEPFGEALAGAIGEAFRGAFNSTIGDGSFLNNLFPESIENMFIELGRDIVRGLIDGLWEGISFVGALLPFSWFLLAVKRLFGVASRSTVFYGIGQDLIQGLIDGVSSLSEAFISKFRSIIDAVLRLPGFRQVAEFLGVDLSTSTGAVSGRTDTSARGGTISAGGTLSTATSQTVTNYFYGPVYFSQSLEDTNYDCPYPNPLVASGSGGITLHPI